MKKSKQEETIGLASVFADLTGKVPAVLLKDAPKGQKAAPPKGPGR